MSSRTRPVQGHEDRPAGRLRRRSADWRSAHVVGAGGHAQRLWGGLVVAALVALASGCISSSPTTARDSNDAAAATGTDAARLAENASEQFPPLLESLELSAAQREELSTLEEQLEGRLEPMRDAGRELALAVARTARRCDSNTMALESAATWAVFASEQVRGSVLDGIDRLHQILKPSQRRALVRRLQGQQQGRESRDEERTDEGARSIGEQLDLSFGQLFTLLTRAQALRAEIEDRVEPWRAPYDRALAAFAEDRFSIRDHAIAKVPAAQLATGALRDSVRTLLPILEPEQCVALADFIEQAVRDYDREAERSRDRG